MRDSLRDIRIVLRSVWVNLALFAGLIVCATVVMLAAGCFPGKSVGELLVKALYMTQIEGAMDGSSQHPITVALVYMVPVLTVLILGEGALRVAGIYLNRKRDRGEWEKLMTQSLSGHAVVCGAGELGRALVTRLRERHPGTSIVVVDKQPGALGELGLSGEGIHGICGDMTSHETLRDANVGKCCTVILASGSDAHNLEAAFKVLEINPNADIHVRLYRSHLSRMMNTATYPNIHFFCPYESAAEAIIGDIACAEGKPVAGA